MGAGGGRCRPLSRWCCPMTSSRCSSSSASRLPSSSPTPLPCSRSSKLSRTGLFGSVLPPSRLPCARPCRGHAPQGPLQHRDVAWKGVVLACRVVALTLSHRRHAARAAGRHPCSKHQHRKCCPADQGGLAPRTVHHAWSAPYALPARPLYGDAVLHDSCSSSLLRSRYFPPSSLPTFPTVPSMLNRATCACGWYQILITSFLHLRARRGVGGINPGLFHRDGVYRLGAVQHDGLLAPRALPSCHMLASHGILAQVGGHFCLCSPPHSLCCPSTASCRSNGAPLLACYPH